MEDQQTELIPEGENGSLEDSVEELLKEIDEQFLALREAFDRGLLPEGIRIRFTTLIVERSRAVSNEEKANVEVAIQYLAMSVYPMVKTIVEKIRKSREEKE